MRRKIQRLACVIATLTMILLGIHIMGFIVRPEATDEVYYQIETLHRLPKDSVEVILYGSSHTFRGVDAMHMYESHGIGAYNYGWHWQQINTVNLFLQDSLLSQTPKVAAIETYYCDSVMTDSNLNSEIYYSRYIHNKDALREYLHQCFGDNWKRYAAYYMPIIALHDNWSALTYRNLEPLEYSGYLLSSMGSCRSHWVTPIPTPYLVNPPQKELPEIAIAELDKIVATCRENGTEILFFTIPYQGEFYYADALAQYAERNGAAYLNLFEYIDEIGLDGATDFSDLDHLNTSGAVKVAEFLGAYIAEHYDVTDMRTIQNNVWQQALDQ